MRLGIFDYAYLTAAAVGAMLLFGRIIPHDRFGYDESDYMYAASKGFAANQLDSPSIPIATFIRKGLGEGMEKRSSGSLSEFIRDNDDIAFYRHFHGPLYSYWILAHSSVFGTNEHTTRLASLTCLIWSFVTVYLGCLWLMPQNQGRVAAVIVSSMLLLSPANIATSVIITPHALYVLTAITSLFAMAKLVQAGAASTSDDERVLVIRRYAYLAVVAVCLAVLTMEYSVLLAVTLIACALAVRRTLFGGANRKQAMAVIGTSALLFLLLFGALWPGGLLKLTIIKNYLYYAYFTLVRSEGYGTNSFATVWMNRITRSPLEYLLVLLAIAAAVHLYVRRRVNGWLFPFGCYAALLLATTLRNKSPMPTYISSLLPPLYVITGVTAATLAAPWRPALRAAAATGIVALLLTSTYLNYYTPSMNGSRNWYANALVEYFTRNDVGAQSLLVPRNAVPTLHYYFPQLQLTPYNEDVEGDELTAIIASRRFDGLLYLGAPPDSIEHRFQQHLPAQKERLPNSISKPVSVVVYDMRRSGL